MLDKQTTIDQDGTILRLFRLFDLTIPLSAPDQLRVVVLRDGRKHLRLDCLYRDERLALTRC
jgi:hypothetical protein